MFVARSANLFDGQGWLPDPLALGNLTMSGDEGGWRHIDRLHQSQEGAGGTTFARHGDLPQRPKLTTPKRPSQINPLG